MIRASNNRTRRSGIALIETVLSSGLLVLFAGGALVALNTSTRAYRTETTSAEIDGKARRALAVISAKLRAANADDVALLNVDAGIDFTRGIGWDDVAEEANFGETERIIFEQDPGDPDDGVDNDLDGLVDEGQVAWIENPDQAEERRTVLCHWVAEDGFRVSVDGARVTIDLALERNDELGNTIRFALTKVVALRNTGVEGSSGASQ